MPGDLETHARKDVQAVPRRMARRRWPSGERTLRVEGTTVSVDKNSFDGTYDQKFFNANGNLVFEDAGTIHATRLSVDQF